MIIEAKRVVLVLIVLSLFGCSPSTSIVLSDGRYIPKSPEFSIIPEEHSYENIGLDFDSIYYEKMVSYLNKVKHMSYTYYRFWPNGRVIRKASESVFPTKAEVEKLNDSRIGYYYVDEREITIELFLPDSTILNWGYFKIYGVIEDGRIKITGSETRGEINHFDPIYYITKQFNNLTEKPDW
jgi:hypothetical protein